MCILGHHWQVVTPSGLPASVKWARLSLGYVSGDKEGELCCYFQPPSSPSPTNHGWVGEGEEAQWVEYQILSQQIPGLNSLTAMSNFGHVCSLYIGPVHLALWMGTWL